MENTGTTLTLEHVSVQLNQLLLLKNISLKVQQGQHWAILGASGSGKSLLLQTIAGKVSVTGGSIQHHYAFHYLQHKNKDGKHRSFHDLIALISPKHTFKNKSNLQNFYYQQRFNSSDAEDADTVETYLKQITPPYEQRYWDIPKVNELLAISNLQDKSIIKLSNGETKRLTIASALLRNPRVLLMDQPLLGLDVETRNNFNAILEAIINQGTQIILCCSPKEIPPSITHVAIIDNGIIQVYGEKANLTEAIQSLIREEHHSQVINHSLLVEKLNEQHLPAFKKLVWMNNVSVKYGTKQILSNIKWHIQQGERWVLRGHNGAGKSTLLSLINGDNPQAYSNDIVLFDRKRGSGESIWDIKKNIGFVSPELHQFFPTDQTCLNVVLSGYYATDGLFRKASNEQISHAVSWLKIVDIAHLENKLLKNISTGEQRLCLLARALVKSPSLLILDEPCQGLTFIQRNNFKAIIDAIAEHTLTSIIYVSHYDEDIPVSMNNVLTLSAGKVVTP